MPKASKLIVNGFALDFKAQVWAAAEQTVPAPYCKKSESRTLAALLPKLMSGGLRVNELTHA